MKATVNGQPRELAENLTLGGVLRELGVATAGIAVAVNGRVVPRAKLDEQRLGEGDELEIIRAVAGG